MFERENASDDMAKKQERLTEQLERKGGQLITEREFLEKKVRSTGDRSQRKAMIEKDHQKLSVRSQCQLLAVNRNRLNSRETKITVEDELIMRDLDELYTKWPF